MQLYFNINSTVKNELFGAFTWLVDLFRFCGFWTQSLNCCCHAAVLVWLVVWHLLTQLLCSPTLWAWERFATSGCCVTQSMALLVMKIVVWQRSRWLWSCWTLPEAMQRHQLCTDTLIKNPHTEEKGRFVILWSVTEVDQVETRLH